ncbi:hypothetical protein D3C71_1683310 [compost metagenome]
MAVLLAKRLPSLELVTQLLLQRRKHRRDAFLVAFSRDHIFQRHRPSPPQDTAVTDSIRYEIPVRGMG